MSMDSQLLPFRPTNEERSNVNTGSSNGLANDLERPLWYRYPMPAMARPWLLSFLSSGGGTNTTTASNDASPD